jgi:betaine reductase
VLDHVPDLVRYGSKPRRESHRWPEIATSLRTHDDAVAYPPNQVVIGNLRPGDLWDRERPWWKQPVDDASAEGPFGDIGTQGDFYRALVEADQFDLIHDGGEMPGGALPLHDGNRLVGWIRADHDADPSLAADVMLENLAIKASGVRALRVRILDRAVGMLAADVAPRTIWEIEV